MLIYSSWLKGEAKDLRLWVHQKTLARNVQAIFTPACYSREEQFAPVLTDVFYDAI